MASSVKIPSKRHKTLAAITIKDIDIVLASMLFFDPTGGNSNTAYSMVKYCLITYLALKNLHCYKNAPISAVFLCLFSVLMGYSTWINTHNPTWSISGFMFGAGIVAMVLTFVDACRRFDAGIVLKRVLVVFTVVLLFNDFLMLILPYNRADSSTVYLVGNKFIVSYAHCLLSGLMLACFANKVAMNRLIILLGAAISFFAGSSTGTMMMIIMLALTLIPTKTRAVVCNPLFIAASVAILNILIWGSANLFQMPEFQNFMVNILHKSADMTGRERLYAATFDFVAMKPVLGWGYLTDIYRITFGYGNAQNGLFHLITQCGILGTTFYFSGLLAALGGKQSRNDSLFGIYAFLFCMVLGSSVEINLSFQFAFGVALICGALRDSKSNYMEK